MIAKLITHGNDRDEAIARMVRAIDEYIITGCQTTLGFCRWAIQHPAFVSGDFDTHFVKKYFTPEVLNSSSEEEMLVAALTAAQALSSKTGSTATQSISPEKQVSQWKKVRR
jgi:acetyl/propionyl-CoA carboxylase alpha subunit